LLQSSSDIADELLAVKQFDSCCTEHCFHKYFNCVNGQYSN